MAGRDSSHISGSGAGGTKSWAKDVIASDVQRDSIVRKAGPTGLKYVIAAPISAPITAYAFVPGWLTPIETPVSNNKTGRGLPLTGF
jgi:hypothetical protein